jgi:hypothetical protein
MPRLAQGSLGEVRMFRSTLLSAIAIGCLFVAGCGKSSAPTAESSQPAASSPQPAPAAPAAKSAEPFNMSSIFPPGPGRDEVLNTCGSCHSVACTATGQRTKERWENIKKAHSGRINGSSSGNVNVMFAYLEQNFNDTKPEPQIPAELQGQGCTPF